MPLVAGPALAHEVRPAYLDIQQTGSTAWQVTWKQPTVGDMAVHLVPHMSNGWLDKPPTNQFAGPGFVSRSWTVTGETRPIAGVTVSIEGLEDTVTDVLVRIRPTGAAEQDKILKPAAPQLTIPGADSSSAMGALGFLRLGFEHILTGPDHLLFVLGLLLVVGGRRKLLATVTAFTVAHSITLAFATLTGMSTETALMNALIALSILFMGVEVVRARRGGTSLTIRKPWIAAFAFGLLHGLGFASGLTGLGLTKGVLAMALALFNLGVEAGHLAFIAVVFAFSWALGRMKIEWPSAIRALPAYAVGGLGAFWTFQYLAILFGWQT
ncbi:HupE/UreJ family protein [soil metagenome]